MAGIEMDQNVDKLYKTYEILNTGSDDFEEQHSTINPFGSKGDQP